MLKFFGRRDFIAPLFRLPGKTLDGDVQTADTDDIECIGFASATCRGAGTGLHHQRGMPLVFIARGGISGVTCVQVAGEKNVPSAAREHFHRQPRPSDNLLILVAFGQIERMMRHDNLCDVGA